VIRQKVRKRPTEFSPVAVSVRRHALFVLERRSTIQTNQPTSRRAADLLVREIPRGTPETQAGEARAALVGRSFECATEIVVCDGSQLVGLIPLEQLLAAGPDTQLRDLVEKTSPTVTPDVDQEVVAARAVHARARSVAVVSPDGTFVGVVPAEPLVATLGEEHDEDMARLGGFLAASMGARAASEEPVRRRLWHRLPWLALGLAGAMLSVGIVGTFEAQLRAEVLLAFFVPAVVYMADAVGTQTETVVIRGMAIGVPLRRIARRELATGLVIGALIAAVFFPFALLVWDEADVAAAVSIALFVSCSIATVVAMALPYALARLGRDPAFGSGPLATVIQDLLSIMVYFAVAAALVT
jgi:magnesium transporter